MVNGQWLVGDYLSLLGSWKWRVVSGETVRRACRAVLSNTIELPLN